MNSSGIRKIDQLLEELESTDKAQLSKKLSDFLKSVCYAVDLPSSSSSPRKVIFNKKNEPQQKRFVAICLLRLLCRKEAAIWEDMSLRIETFSFFDEHLDEIYKDVKIKKEDPNHEKLGKLCEIERQVLSDFDQITNSITSLNMALNIRQRFMQTLHSPVRNSLFLEHFSNPSLIGGERLKEIFETVEMYNESSMEDRFASYQNIQSVFDSFLRDARNNQSIFTDRCIVAPVQKVYHYVKNDFQSNDAIKQTTVTISPLDRKYPFHVIGKRVGLKFRVKNNGPGYAFDIQIELEVDKGLKLCNPIVNPRTLAHHQSLDIVFEISVEDKIGENPDIMGQLYWRNFDGSSCNDDFIFALTSQPTALDWDNLKKQQPYPLEPVKQVKNLVGRTEFKDQLCTKLLLNQIESSIICGQKRVGKTSIAEVVQAEFEKKENYTVIYISTGGLDKTTSERFVANLGNRIVSKVSRAYKLLERINNPSFDSSLSPLVEYFEDARELSSNHRFIIILDEFDEIPLEMVRYDSNVGDTFFHNIREISSMGNVGLVLVGAENMLIIEQSTDRFNKMELFKVDYFDKGKYWDDFQELVRRPVKGNIEFNNEAINTLYEMTEGNPFYTKCICRKIYSQACVDRNSYISEDNVRQAIQTAIEELDLNHFNHFWKDGIFVDDPARKDQIETQRRKFLIAFAQIKRKKTSVNRQDFQDLEILKNEVAVEEIIESYKNRGILIEETGHYRLKPKIFEDWLIGVGHAKMTTGFLDENAITKLEQREQDVYVLDKEIVELCQKRRLYKGSEITTIQVRAWLDQFKDNSQKRLMFSLLQNVKFYNEIESREKIRVLHKEVQKDLAQMGAIRSADGRTKRDDILLSSFGPPSKSGSYYARLYADENNIFVSNEIRFDKIQEALQGDNPIKAIVFVDDIISSGGSTIESLYDLNKTCGGLIKRNNVKVFISAICGLHIGMCKLRNAIEEVPFKAEVIVGDPLTECFSDQSEVFSSTEDQRKAKLIAREYGQKLEKKHPLGYQNSQLLVVFHDNCPNNTLPILWKESTGKIQWTPLFKRS